MVSSPGCGFHLGKIDGCGSSTRGGVPVLKRRMRDAQLRAVRLPDGEDGSPCGPPIQTAFADDDAAVHIHAGADDDRPAGDGSRRWSVSMPQIAPFSVRNPTAFALTNGQVVGSAKSACFITLLIGAFIRLRTEGMDGGPFARVEHAGLDERIVDGPAHFAAERVNLAHQMPLARAADGGVAGHEGDGVQIEREQQRIKPHARAQASAASQPA